MSWKKRQIPRYEFLGKISIHPPRNKRSFSSKCNKPYRDLLEIVDSLATSKYECCAISLCEKEVRGKKYYKILGQGMPCSGYSTRFSGTYVVIDANKQLYHTSIGSKKLIIDDPIRDRIVSIIGRYIRTDLAVCYLIFEYCWANDEIYNGNFLEWKKIPSEYNFNSVFQDILNIMNTESENSSYITNTKKFMETLYEFACFK